jgi:hypothetical protein
MTPPQNLKCDVTADASTGVRIDASHLYAAMALWDDEGGAAYSSPGGMRPERSKRTAAPPGGDLKRAKG